MKIKELYQSYSSKKAIKYLGFYFWYFSNNKLVKDPTLFHQEIAGFGLQLKFEAITKLRLSIPVELILRRAVYRGYAIMCKNGKLIKAISWT